MCKIVGRPKHIEFLKRVQIGPNQLNEWERNRSKGSGKLHPLGVIGRCFHKQSVCWEWESWTVSNPRVRTVEQLYRCVLQPSLLAHQGAFIFVVLPAPLEKWSRTAAQQPDPVGWGDASGTLSDTSPCAPEPSNEAAQRSGPWCPLKSVWCVELRPN